MPLSSGRRRLPRLRTLLLLSNLLVLSLPLAGLYFLRLYESALIRQTEAELVAQAAVLAAAYRMEMQHRVPGGDSRAPESVLPQAALDRVRRAGLDLARDPVLPPPPDPRPTALQPSVLAAETGQVLVPVLRDAQQVTLAAIRVLDERGVIVATTGKDLGQSLAAMDEVQGALRGEPVSNMRARVKPAEVVPQGISRASWLRVFVALPVLQDGRVAAVVLLSRTPYTLGQAVWGKRFELGLLALGLLAAVVLLAVGASRLITRPFAQLIGQAKAVAMGEPDRFVPPARPGTREVQELSAAIARMAGALEQRAEYIRNFAAHLSHEFKTPLAGMKGAAELIADHDATMRPEERKHFLGVIDDGVARLNGLVGGMLDLARADMMRPLRSGGVALRPVLDELAARCLAHGLPVQVDCGDLRAALHEDALEMILGNLLENAALHGGPGVSATVSARRDGKLLWISVCDDGRGVPAADAARVFDPFFTTRRPDGTGLGLAIVQSAARGAGGDVRLVPKERGTEFIVTLPAAEA